MRYLLSVPCFVLSAVAGLLASGCASVETHPLSVEEWKTEAHTSGGVTYWLPRRSIRVVLTRVQDGPDALAVEGGPAYADYSRAFVLTQPANLLAEQKLNVVVDERGLLQSADASTSPRLSEALQELARTTAAVATADKRVNGKECKAGVYALQILPETLSVTKQIDKESVAVREGEDVDVGARLCDYTVTAARLFPPLLVTQQSDLVALKLTQRNGFYVRAQLPYRVTVIRGQESPKQFIVHSPSEAPPSFVPLSTALFATVSTKLTFGDGSIKGFDQTKQSEAVAFLALPAQVIGAYFDAIGNLFSKRQKALVNEADYLKARSDLSAAQLKSDVCGEAIRRATTLEDVKPVCLSGK